MNYSRSQLENIAKSNIQELVKIINHSGADINLLVNSIEVLGEETVDNDIVLPIFTKYLKHIHVAVREGVMVSILSCYSNKGLPGDIVCILKLISKNDPSSDLKEFALDLLKEFR